MASGGWLWKLPRHGGKRFFSRGVLSKRYFTIRGSDSVVVLTWFDEMPGEDGGDANGCLMLSYVEPVPPSLKQVKLNMGTTVDEADFSKEISRTSQRHLSEHSFIINFRDGPGLKLCAESESDKFRWVKALRAAIESPKAWRDFMSTSNKMAEDESSNGSPDDADDPIKQFMSLMRDEKDVPKPKTDRRLSHRGRLLFSRTVVDFSSSQRNFRTREMYSPKDMNSTNDTHASKLDDQEYIPSVSAAHPYRQWEDVCRRDTDLAGAVEKVLRRLLHGGKGYVPPDVDDMGNTKPYDLMSPELFGRLTNEVESIMKAEPSLVRLEAPIKVFGDIHGQIADLLTFFTKFGFPSHIKGDINCINYLFAGDYVDRGSHGLEVLTVLFCLKLRYNPHIVLLRGNHEDGSVNARYGFHHECVSRFVMMKSGRARLMSVVDPEEWGKLYDSIQRVFEMMPVGALIASKILVIHGGIGQNVWELKDIDAVKRPFKPLGATMNLASEKIDPVAVDLLWSDPTDEEVGLHPHAMESFNAKRGVGTKFGIEAVENFCRVNDVELIIRAHECVKSGWKLSCKGRCVTVFSAPNYCGTHNNAGAMLEINRDLHIHCKKVLPRSSKGVWLNQVDATPPPSDASSVSSTEEQWM